MRSFRATYTTKRTDSNKQIKRTYGRKDKEHKEGPKSTKDIKEHSKNSVVQRTRLALPRFTALLMKQARRPTSTGTHSSSVRVGQMWWGSVIVVLSGLRMTLVRSAFTCKARRIRIRREKAVYEEMVFSQSSYRLNSTICGSVAFKIMSPSFSTCTG